MTDIFVSYAHKDQERARYIVQTLTGQGYTVWLDEHNLRANEAFTEAIAAGIRGCSVFLMLYSPAYHASEYCQKEYAYAVDVCGRNVACVWLDEDRAWISTRYAFDMAGRDIPGFQRRSSEPEELTALCERLYQSQEFVALRQYKLSGSDAPMPVIPYENRPKLRFRSSFEASVRHLGQYMQGAAYDASLALQFSVGGQREEEDGEKHDASMTSLADLIPAGQAARLAICGSGGFGKTTALLRYGEGLLDARAVVYIHLTDVRWGGESHSQQYHIESYIRERICQDEGTWQYLHGAGTCPELSDGRPTILLDGLNELPALFAEKAAKEIADMADAWINADLIVSSRSYSFAQTNALEQHGFRVCRAAAPSHACVKAYLEANGIPARQVEARVLELLRNPLRLTMYVRTQPNYEYYRARRYLKPLLHEKQDTVGKIMDHFLASQLYHYVETCAGDDALQPQITAFVIGEIALPYLAWQAYRESRFALTEDEVVHTLRRLTRLVPGAWEEYEAERLQDLGDAFHFRSEYRWQQRDAQSVLASLNLLTYTMETDEDGEPAGVYTFPHQSFRDYFAARYLALDLQTFLVSGQNAGGEEDLLLGEELLSEDVIQMLSDVMQEERARPVCDGEQEWVFPGKKPGSSRASSFSPAEKALDKLRGRTDEAAQRAVYNILTLLRYSRKNLLGACCFDRLDLRLCQLRGAEYTQWYRDQLCPSSFDGAVFTHENFFSGGHLSWVNAVCPGAPGRLLSGDADGAIIESEIRTGKRVRGWKLPQGRIRRLAWDDGRIAAITTHSVFLLDTRTGAAEPLVLNAREYMHRVRFADDGEVEYAVDVQPMVWFRADGSRREAAPVPRWVSGAYELGADGRHYWRSGLNRHLYRGTLQEDGTWLETGGRLADFFPERVAGLLFVKKKLTDLVADFPISRGERKKHSYVTEDAFWPETQDPVITGLRKRLSDYLASAQDKNAPDTDPEAAAALKKEIRMLLDTLPDLTGGRFKSMALRPDGRRIMVSCRNMMMEFDAESMAFIRSARMSGQISQVVYLSGEEGAYAAACWNADVSVLTESLDVLSACTGDYPVRKISATKGEDGRYYLLCSDGYMRQYDENYRVSRMRQLGRYSVARYHFGEDGGLRIAHPLETSRWTGGCDYCFDTDRLTPLGSSYRDDGKDVDDGVLPRTTRDPIYFLDRCVHLIVPEEPEGFRDIYYIRDLYIFGCSFRHIAGDLTDEEKYLLYMNGGLTE
ncbi:MAG: TIR domain-containing protein [Clostridia bacterium]|nr:TIR domain-containing protein [Clostridia bacterium]